VIQRLQQGMAGNAIAGGIMKLSLVFFSQFYNVNSSLLPRIG
jgi:hypothetical protein